MKPEVRRKRLAAVAVALGVLCIASIVFSCCVGSAGYSFGETLSVFGDLVTGGETSNPTARTVLLNIRLPRVLLAFVVGAALAVSGACMQGVFKNPMAEPGILGVSSGASFGAAVAIILGISTGLMGMGAVSVLAFAFSLAAVLVVYALARIKGRVSTLSLLLSGTAVSSFLSALTTALLVFNNDKLENVYMWTMGSFGAASWNKLAWCFPLVLAGAIVCMIYSRDLNAMLLGDTEAKSLGVDVRRTRLIILVASSLTTAAAVASCGAIGFVGLMVPHAMRMLIGPDHRQLLPYSFFAGGVYLILMDTLARTIIAPQEFPVGVLTSLVGGPFFVYLLRKRL